MGALVLIAAQGACLSGGLFTLLIVPYLKTLAVLFFKLFFSLITLFEFLFQLFKRKETSFVDSFKTLARKLFDQRVKSYASLT